MVEGFKNTDIGVIPNNWDVHELGAVASYRRGSFPQPYGLPKWYDDKNGMPFVQVFDVDENMMLKPETKQKISDAAKDKSVFVPKGSIVLTIQGSIGRIAVTQYDAYVDRTLLIFQSFKKPIDKWFFMYVVYQLFQIEKAKAPGGTIKTITKAELSSFLIPLPPTKAEQTAIATALNDADELIQKLEQLIAKKRNIKTGAMQELLKPKEGWEVKKLGEVANFFSGGTPSTSISAYYGGNISWITSSDLNKEKIFEVEGKITEEGLRNSSAKMVKKGTLLLALYGATAGVTAVTFIEAAINQAVLAIEPFSDNSEFLFYKLSSLKSWIVSTFTQGGQANLSGNIIKSLELQFPTLEEQNRIAQILSDMDNEIQELEKQLEKYRMMKQGMMQSLLTGKIRLV